MSLEDFIQNNFLKRQTEQENARSLQDFDAETMRMRQMTKAEQRRRGQDLERDLADMGEENAGDFAARGLERSGLIFQAQDRINQQGQERREGIGELLTNLLSERGQGRLQTQRGGEKLLNQRIAELTQQFNSQNQGQIPTF